MRGRAEPPTPLALKYRDTINAMEGVPRFSIRKAKRLADQVEDICERRGEGSEEFLSFLIQTSLARAYIKHGNFKAAQRILARNWERLYTTTNLGPLHQVIFLRTYARYYAAQEAYGQDLNHVLHEAVRIASEAGLDHQSNELRLEFGIGRDELSAVS